MSWDPVAADALREFALAAAVATEALEHATDALADDTDEDPR